VIKLALSLSHTHPASSFFFNFFNFQKGYHIKRGSFRALEAKEGRYSCWIAFVDEEAAKQHLGDKFQEKSSCGMPNATRFGIWNMVVIPQDAFPFPVNQTAKNSRVPKMLIHRAFNHADHLIYMDSKLVWKDYHDIWPHIMKYANEPNLGWVSPHHPSRHSVFEEARCVHIVGLANDEVIYQMRRYFQEGMPSGHGEAPFGLIEGEWHYRNLKSRVSSKIGCDWFREFSSWNHRRDQLSFNYILWKNWKSDWFLHESRHNITSPRPDKNTPLFAYANYHYSPFERVVRTTVQAQTRGHSASCDDLHHGNRIAMELEAMISKSRWTNL
jgi:hypothetical protein